MSEKENISEATPTTAVVEKKATTAVVEKNNWQRLHGSWKERIERMLPEPRMIDQFMYAAEVSMGRNKALEGCSPVSVLNCLLTSAKYGILPDGRNAHLIPYGQECQLQFDYKGFVHILVRDGVAKKVYCETICSNDKFVWQNGEIKDHEISFPRGEILGVYCDITLADGTHQYELMERDEIDKIKACSRGSSSPSSPWNRFYAEMAKKSVFRRATKWLKLSPDVMDAMNNDGEQFDFNAPLPAVKSSSLFQKDEQPAPKQIAAPAVTVAEAATKKEDDKLKVVAKSAMPF